MAIFFFLSNLFCSIFAQINKWAVAGTSIASQVRSLRKVNTDQVAIPIDMDDGSNSRLEDEDEDKGILYCFQKNILFILISASSEDNLYLKAYILQSLFCNFIVSSVHGFKSLTTSRVVPRFTRPLSDMIDGLWQGSFLFFSLF